jgi:hypothetical protein
VTIAAAADCARLRCCATEAINSVTSSCRTNDCMCRSDRVFSAIQTGASESCQNAIDATSAVAVYTSYCRANGYVRPSFTSGTVSSPEGECDKYSDSAKSLISLLVAIKGTLIQYRTVR